MADLDIDIDANIKQIAADVKRLNKNLEDTAEKTNKAGRSAKDMGDKLSTAFKAFVIGGALQKGITKIADDIERSNKRATTLNDSLRTLRFLGGEEAVVAARVSMQSGAKFGISGTRTAEAAANVISTAGNLSTAVRQQILEEAGAADAGGVGSFEGFSGAVAKITQTSSEFQTSAGVVQAGNLITQGITEAELLKKDVGKLSLVLVEAKALGITPSEGIAAFAILTKATGSPDAAIEKMKQIGQLWIKTGAKGAGFSYLAYIQATNAKTDKERSSEENILGGAFGAIAGAEAEGGIFTGTVARVKKARFGKSLTNVAFQRQLGDSSTAIDILQEEADVLDELQLPSFDQQQDTTAAGATVGGIGNVVSSIFKVLVGQYLTAGTLGLVDNPLSPILVESAAEDLGTSIRRFDQAANIRAIENSTQATQAFKAAAEANSVKVAP